MADKTVNVNIKYNVDTSGVQKAQAASQAAQVATDNLRKASDQFARQFAANNVKSTDTIAGLTLKMQQLKAQIELTSLTDTKRLAALSGQYKALQTQVDSYNKSLLAQNTATKTVSASTNELSGQFQNLYTSVKLLLTAGLVKEFISVSLEAAKLSGNVEGVKRAFDKLPNSVGVLNDLRSATKNAVTDLELMQKALLAKNYGISLEALPKLLEFAAVRAQQTGKSVDYLVNSIVDGIGRKSLRVLDNLQLSTSEIKSELGGVSMEAATVAQVSEAMGRIASRELQKMGGFAETSATEVDRLTASWHDLRVEISKTATEGPAGGVTGWLQSYVDSAKLLFEAINKGITVEELAAEKQRQTIAQISANEFATRALTGTKEQNIKAIEDEIAALTKSIGSWASFRDMTNDIIEELKEEQKSIQNSTRFGLLGPSDISRLKEIKEQIDLRTRLIDANKEDALLDQEIIRLLQGRLQALKQVNKETEKELELRDKILGRDTLSEKAKPAKDPFVQRMIAGQPLVDTKAQLDKLIDEIQTYLYLKPLKVKIQVPEYEDSEFQKAWEENMYAVRMSVIDNTNSIIQSELQAEVDAYSARIEMARQYYDDQMDLAGDNQRAKQEIRIREDREIQKLERARNDREKKAGMAGILVNTGLGILKVFAGEGTWVDKLIRAAIVAGEGATQYAIASRARYYAKGEINIKGPGSETSDSIPAMLSKGESVMTAKQTREAFGILTDVRAGKLNDRVLRQLVSNGGSQAVMDDSRIVDAIKKQPRPPDLVRQGREIYEVYTAKEGHKRYIRSKSMG